MLTREPIRARLPEGRGVVSGPHTTEERCRLVREARHALEEWRAAREMAENKEEQADRRTPEELARDEEEAGALHERLRTKTPFVTHH